ncbi:MAG: tRNA lysidine(34) synthetase TilS [Paracoccaceae bacterium]
MSLSGLRAAESDADLLDAAGRAFEGDAPKLLGVAVSGGSDSMAALHLMVQAAQHAGWEVHAVTVDHGLRPEARDEAAHVGRICAGLGVAHDVLVWEHGAISGNLMDQARRARYRLMADWARARGIGHVVLGHTADDQAETFLMGLAREAGLEGLSGMRAAWREGGVVFGRPFLAIPREDLRGYLRRRGVTWLDDPTNADAHYTRVKARRVLAALTPLGITVRHLSRVVDNLNFAQSALVQATVTAASQVAIEAAGGLVFDRAGFQALPFEVQRRLLIAGLRWVSAAAYAPRAAALGRVQGAILSGADTTLWGCRIRVGAAGICITREPRAVAGVVCDLDQMWDGRWRLMGPKAAGLTVRALGAVGLRQCKNWRECGVSRDALLVSPAIWRDDTLVAAPVAGVNNGFSAKIDAGFNSFIVSH